MKYNTITKQVSETVPGGIYEGIDYHGTPPADVAERAGWVDVTPEIQAQIDADAAAAQAAFDAAEIIRKNTPLVFDQPLETASLVLQSHEAAIGVGVIADDDGELLTFAYHASPIPSPSEIKARKDAAKAKRSAAKAVVIDKGNKFRNANASANNVPAMRAALVILQEQMAAMQELLGVTDGAVVTP